MRAIYPELKGKEEFNAFAQNNSSRWSFRITKLTKHDYVTLKFESARGSFACGLNPNQLAILSEMIEECLKSIETIYEEEQE